MSMETWLRRATLAAACGALLLPATPLRAQARGEAAGKAAFAVDAKKAQAGAGLWTAKGCAACHGIGAEKPIVGPDLAGVLDRRERAWLQRWLRAPDEMLQSDSIAKALFAEYGQIPMPNLKLSDEEIEALLHYIARESAKAKSAKGGAP